jgi:dGTPase
VDQRLELQAATAVLADAPHRDGHAVLAVAIEARLRAVTARKHMDGPKRCRGQAQLLGFATERRQGLRGLGGRDRALEAKEQGHRMTVGDRHTVYRCRDVELCVPEGSIGEVAQDLERLALDLLLLAPADVGHDVVGNVHGRHARIAGSGQRLQCHDLHAGQREGPMQGGEGHGQAGHAAVRVRDDVAPARALALDGYGLEVARVDFGDEERNVGIHPVVAGVRHHRVVVGREQGFHLSRHRRVEAREEKSRAKWPFCPQYRERRNTGGGRSRQAPGAGLAIGLPGGAVRGGEFGHLEPGVMLEELHEALSHGAGRSQDADRDFHGAVVYRSRIAGMRVDRVMQEAREDRELAPYGMRSARSRGRLYPEEEHPLRTRYQRDRDRVVHCSSFRRLEYKTQVFVNHEGDNYRTRLTHSLEAAQVGRTVARALGLNEEMTETLCLGHDLGHTPFGHSGEKVMAELMREHGGFEHNQQTLRILEVLEQPYPEFPGLNLTWEVREGLIKHRPDSDENAPAAYAPGERPTLEAQLVDFVDEIAYNNHDVDDGLTSGMIDIDALRSVELFRDSHDLVLARGIEDPSVVRHQVVRAIIDRCTRDLIDATLANLEAAQARSVEDVRRAGRRLVAYSPAMQARVTALKEFLLKNLYRHYRVVRMGDKAGRILRDLFVSFSAEPLQLPPHFQKRIAVEGLPRVVCDYIAGMTDRFALDEHRKLFDPLVRV